MKTAMVLMIVLWAGMGWAGEQFDFATTQSTSGLFRNVQCPDAGPEVCQAELHIQPGYTVLYGGRSVACLDTMEAAMRAMEPFAVPKSGIRMTTDREYPDAVMQWESVKRECWRKP